jgi:hypothetical protein
VTGKQECTTTVYCELREQSHAPRLCNPTLNEAASGFVDNKGQVKWIVPRDRMFLPG